MQEKADEEAGIEPHQTHAEKLIHWKPVEVRVLVFEEPTDKLRLPGFVDLSGWQRGPALMGYDNWLLIYQIYQKFEDRNSWVISKFRGRPLQGLQPLAHRLRKCCPPRVTANSCHTHGRKEPSHLTLR